MRLTCDTSDRPDQISASSQKIQCVVATLAGVVYRDIERQKKKDLKEQNEHKIATTA